MEHFQVTVRLLELLEPDAATARLKVEERLRAAGFSRWQIISLGLQAMVTSPQPPYRPPQRRPNTREAGVGMLLAAAVAWLLWLVWLLGG
ncbi:MAG: hypothetical protein ACHQ9S_08325 [Candidatus Binatia bacterium]